MLEERCMVYWVESDAHKKKIAIFVFKFELWKSTHLVSFKMPVCMLAGLIEVQVVCGQGLTYSNI